MTQNPAYNPRSARFQMDEVLSGMLASFPGDSFSDDTHALGERFKQLSAAFPLFAPFAALADGEDYSVVLREALELLVAKGWLQHQPGSYILSEAGRRSCISNKRSLFSNADMLQLEAASRMFAEGQDRLS